MAKRIYVGLEDPRRAEEVSRATGIELNRLQQAVAGKIELSSTEQKKVEEALERYDSDSIKKPFGN